jgi:hypothetical protein
VIKLTYNADDDHGGSRVARLHPSGQDQTAAALVHGKTVSERDFCRGISHPDKPTITPEADPEDQRLRKTSLLN